APGHGDQSIYRRADMLGEVQAPVGLSVRLPRTRRSVSPRCREIIQMARGWLCLHCRDLRSLAQESGVAHRRHVFVRRRPRQMRWEGRVADAVARLMSAFWILSANSWMQTPVGYEMRDGIAYPADWLDIVFNPSFPYRLAHMVISASRRK